MKTKHGIFFGFAVMLAAAIFTLAGCPTDGGGSSVSEVTYTGKAGDDTYVLTITKADDGKAAYTPRQGDRYVLTITKPSVVLRSIGTVSEIPGAGEFTLKPSNPEAPTFTANVTGDGLTGMSGTITLDSDLTEPAPDTLTPVPQETPGNDGGNSGDNSGDNGGGNNGDNVPATNGKLTVTNIPSEYNGKYIFVHENGNASSTESIICVGSIDYLNFQEKRMDYSAAEITNGRAILNVYMMSVSESNIYNILGYSGNDTVEMTAVFHHSSNVINGSGDGNGGDGGWDGDWGDRTWIAESEPVTVKFSSGNGTFVFNEMSETRDWPNFF